MLQNPLDQLSRRERQIMEILLRLGHASATEVRDKLQDAPGYSAVRSALRLLEKKGLVSHREEGLKFVFEPKLNEPNAKESALRQVISTFFQNSAMQAVQTLLTDDDLNLSNEELDKIESLLNQARNRK